MKKITLLFIFLSTSILSAQDITDWQVGVMINPFFFARFNDTFYPKVQNDKFPNGYGYGITLEKNWTDSNSWGVKIAFENTTQNEQYIIDATNVNTNVKSSFEYYKAPITLQYYKPINQKLYLVFNQGFQVSKLKYFKTEIADAYQIKTYLLNYGNTVFFQHPEQNYSGTFDYDEFRHKKYLFGLIGSVGIKGFLLDKISYSTSLKYEYDLNTADSLPYFSHSSNSYSSEGVTHNLRIGIELGIQYHFEINDIFDKSPIKL